MGIKKLAGALPALLLAASCVRSGDFETLATQKFAMPSFQTIKKAAALSKIAPKAVLVNGSVIPTKAASNGMDPIIAKIRQKELALVAKLRVTKNIAEAEKIVNEYDALDEQLSQRLHQLNSTDGIDQAMINLGLCLSGSPLGSNCGGIKTAQRN